MKTPRRTHFAPSDHTRRKEIEAAAPTIADLGKTPEWMTPARATASVHPTTDRLAPVRCPDVKCPECDEVMLLRDGSNGTFYGCARFPTCRGTRSFPLDAQARKQIELERQKKMREKKFKRRRQPVYAHWGSAV
jgi:Topoisomerase DNA binding C4 zinc finger